MMNKNIFITSLVLFTSANLIAQKIDYNKIILPNNVKDISIEERLIQIAWDNHPRVKIAANNQFITEKRLIREKSGWLELVRIQGNLNEFTIDPDPSNPRSNFYPRYNFGIAFTLGTFSTIPLDVKIARANLKNEQETINELKLGLRAEVLNKYYDYKANLEMLNMQKQSVAETEAQYKLVETKFRTGESTISEFNSVRDRYETQKLRLINTENNYLKTKVSLEAVIGMSLESILN